MARGDGRSARGMFDRDKASRARGIELILAGDGAASARMRVTADLVGRPGTTHGGARFRGRGRVAGPGRPA